MKLMKLQLTKRVLALLLSLVMVFSTLPVSVLAAERSYDGTETLYVDLGAVEFWLSDNAAQRAYFYGADGNAWAEFSLTEGTVYETLVPAGTWTNVILVRCNPEYQGSNYWDAKWSQTGDIDLDASKNFITFDDGAGNAYFPQGSVRYTAYISSEGSGRWRAPERRR